MFISVWQKLEEENREFFKAYHVRLMVKNQIVLFNKLLQQQADLMQKICPSRISSLPISNGSQATRKSLSELHHRFLLHAIYISIYPCFLSKDLVIVKHRPDFCIGLASSHLLREIGTLLESESLRTCHVNILTK